MGKHRPSLAGSLGGFSELQSKKARIENAINGGAYQLASRHTGPAVGRELFRNPSALVHSTRPQGGAMQKAWPSEFGQIRALDGVNGLIYSGKLNNNNNNNDNS